MESEALHICCHVINVYNLDFLHATPSSCTPLSRCAQAFLLVDRHLRQEENGLALSSRNLGCDEDFAKKLHEVVVDDWIVCRLNVQARTLVENDLDWSMWYHQWLKASILLAYATMAPARAWGCTSVTLFVLLN